MNARTVANRSGRIVVVMAMLATFLTMLLPGQTAEAATGDIGHADQLYTGATNPPTADKPQSKLWYNDGLWWANMFETTSKTWHIFRLDRPTETWIDTGTKVDSRPQASSDALWDGTKLYIGSQYVTVSDDTTTRPSQTQKAYLYRYTYSSVTKTYSLESGFPSQISTNSSESLTIDKDSTGRVWATWTKVSGSSSAGYTSAVYVNSSVDGSVWGTPMVIPAPGASSTVAPDDISGVVAFGKATADKGRIGVLWSNHLDDTVYWAVHKDADPVGTWKGSVAIRGSKQADDHLNLKTIDADAQGRVVAAVKTSLDELSTSKSTDPQIKVLVFKPGTGSWTATTFGTLADCHTRPLVMLDSTNNEVHVFATGPTESGCAYAGKPGSIYEKTTSLDSPSFASGRGTPVIRDTASANMNNVTSTKQSVTSASGLVVLASNNTTKRYWHADESLRGSTPAVPTASFSASPTSGTAPLTVSFTDTSTNNPTSWAWDFGNGTTSTAQNPSTTYTAAGTYTASLKATNAAGTSTAATKTITVTSAGPSVPMASFSASPTSGTAPLTVSFTDTSTNNPTSWAWDFGNGTTSTAQNPSTTYTAAGTYTASLQATNAAGTSTAATKTITVTSGGGSTTRTITLNPDADTMVKQASSTSNFGTVASLLADQQDLSTSGSAINSYLRFTVPALAPGESITDAKISVKATNGTNNGPAIYQTATTWNESTMSWSSGRPTRSPSTTVGNFGSMTSAARYSTTVSGVTAAGAVSFELAPESTDGLGFPSREVSATSDRPQLVLTITTA